MICPCEHFERKWTGRPDCATCGHHEDDHDGDCLAGIETP